MELFKEIGGNFPLDPIPDQRSNHWVEQVGSSYFFSSGRAAILAMIQLSNAAGKKVALPYFTCHSVIEPFDRAGCELVFYPVNPKLRLDEMTMIEFCSKEQPFLLLYHDYFGNVQEEIWKELWVAFQDQILFVNDQTHSFFGVNESYAHFSLMSMRKWGAISEGGMLRVPSKMSFGFDYANRLASDVRLECYVQASELKLEYLNNDQSKEKELFRKLFYQSESFFDQEQEVYPMHPTALTAWRQLLDADFRQRRKRNSLILSDAWSVEWNIWGEPIFDASSTAVPLYFPILLKVERKLFQIFLAERNVYAPIIWPKSSLISIKGDDVLYNQLICLPIDQRYGESDMNRLVCILDEFHNQLDR